MKAFIINNKKVLVYDSIDEMPIINFQKYNKYLLIDSGIGSDIDDIDRHIVKLAKLIKTSPQKAIQELQNMRQNMFMIASQISPKYMAFAALIYSIDGKPVEDLSDSNLKDILDSLNKAKHSKVIEFLENLKKKVGTELETYFPSKFIDAKEKEAYDMLKHRTMLELNSVLSEEDYSDRICQIDDRLFSLHKPKSFSGKDSIEIKYDKQFETACLGISQVLHADARQMTVLQFYNALDIIEQQNEQKAKALNRNKR